MAAVASARRERIATAILAGFMGAPTDVWPDVQGKNGAVALAVSYADALIAALDGSPSAAEAVVPKGGKRR